MKVRINTVGKPAGKIISGTLTAVRREYIAHIKYEDDKVISIYIGKDEIKKLNEWESEMKYQ